jgi:C4-dicarboxylate transporter DctM subunit
MVLYAVSSVSGVSAVRLARELLPFIAVLIVVLGLITYVPALVTWLPNALMGPAR